MRTLAEDNDLTFPLEPLDKERAQKLEVPYFAVYYTFFSPISILKVWCV